MKIRDIIPVAMEERKPHKVVKNARVVNVFTGKVEHTSIAFFRKRIAGIGDYTSADEVIDVEGMYVLPGFIDAHLHIESSMLIPRQFARAVLLRGTTTVVADPHEIANVMGVEGIEYMLNSTEGIPLNVYIGLPSAVPATRFETSGASIGADEVIFLLDRYPKRIIALGEVMNYPGVLNRERELITMIEISRHRYKKIDGHAPGLSGKALNGYVSAFIRSDHECTSRDEALEKVARGMQVFIREGSAAKNLEELVQAVEPMNHYFFSFCTDDRDPLDILYEGHIDYLVKKSIEMGVDPVIAVRMATINTARYYNLRSMGAIAPGYKADLVVVDDLRKMNIKMVIKDGRVVVRDGKLLDPVEGVYREEPDRMGDIRLPYVSEQDLVVKANNGKIRVIEVLEGSIFTNTLITEPKVENGVVLPDEKRDIAKIAVFNRYGGDNFTVGFVKGLGIKRGAIGTSVGHDAHNVCVAGMNDRDMIIALRRIEELNGGMVVVCNGRVVAELALPIAGLMSKKELFEVVEVLKKVRSALGDLGTHREIFMTLSFVQLAVIPQLRITDKGLVDVNAQEFVGLFA